MPLPSYSRGGGSGNPGSAPCRVTTDKSALQTTSHGGHDSFLLGRGSGRYQRVNGTYWTRDALEGEGGVAVQRGCGRGDVHAAVPEGGMQLLRHPGQELAAACAGTVLLGDVWGSLW